MKDERERKKKLLKRDKETEKRKKKLKSEHVKKENKP